MRLFYGDVRGNSSITVEVGSHVGLCSGPVPELGQAGLQLPEGNQLVTTINVTFMECVYILGGGHCPSISSGTEIRGINTSREDHWQLECGLITSREALPY